MRSRAHLIDSHVHLHECFDLELFLEGAARNFGRIARELGLPPEEPGVLLLTENLGEPMFERLADPGRGDAGAWSFSPSAEPVSLLVRNDGRVRLILVAGRQVVSAEGLEVLALGVRDPVREGEAVRATLAEVRQRGGLPVLPWGVGKWWSRRGRVVAGIIEDGQPTDLFLGDNGGRPHLLGRPPLFETARRRGLRILPGSDPLPLPDQSGRAGSYGFVARSGIDLERPAASLFKLVRDPGFRPEPYGTGETLPSFVRNQLAMQLRKRTGR